MLTDEQIQIFCQVFNLDKSALQRKYIFDVNELTLEEFFLTDMCFEKFDDFEDYLHDFYIQEIVNMKVNDEHKNRLDIIDVKRIS